MNRFLSLYFGSLLIGFLVGLFVGLLIAPLNFKRYEVECKYNDRKILVNLDLSGFTETAAREMAGGACVALKAFRECKYLRAHWPEAKKRGTNLLASGIVQLVRIKAKGNYCAYTRPGLHGRRVFVALWGVVGCPEPGELIFHEFLHLSGLPNHNESLPLRQDPIHITTNVCFGG